jgi:Bax protein
MPDSTPPFHLDHLDHLVRALQAPSPLAIRQGVVPFVVAAVCLGTAYGWHAATYSRLPDFAQWPAGEDRKMAFFDYLSPLLEAENSQVLSQRKRLETIAARVGDSEPGRLDRHRLRRLAEEYQVDTDGHDTAGLIEALRLRVDAIPVSLGLAQGAKESGWGTSRFAVAGNALFGERCFRPGCGVVPHARRSGSRHEVRAFDSPRAAVKAYVRNLNTHRDYEALRERRAELRAAGEPVSGHDLAPLLLSYSERGESYVREVQALIRNNRLSTGTAQ